MRNSCYDCARKHLAQALIVSHELEHYAGDESDDHLWVWVGHMAEAADQIQKNHPDVAARIREIRLKIMENSKLIYGVDINALIRELNELAALSSIQSPSLYDPYPTWHSHNANPTGSNYCQFMDEEADEIIETLRQSVSDSSTIRRLYNDFQQIIYERQPAIFLVSPTINLALRTNLKLESLKIRPGYYENLVVFD